MSLQLSSQGLDLDAPSPGDIVTVLIRPPKDAKKVPAGLPRLSLFALDRTPDHENPSHYRVNALWQVLAVNGGQAVVRQLTGHGAYKAKSEVWAIGQHRWFDASELWEVLREDQERWNEEDAARDREMADILGKGKLP